MKKSPPTSQEERDYNISLLEQRNSLIRTISTNVTIITALITAGVTVYKTYTDFQTAKYLHNREIYKTELTFVDSHLDTAVLEDVGIRLRFAEYFKSVAPTAEQREGWENYYLLVKEEFNSKPPKRDSL